MASLFPTGRPELPIGAVQHRRLDVDQVQQPEMLSLLEFWRVHSGEGRLPLRTAFLPEAFPKAIGNLAFVEVKGNGDYVYRVTAGHVLQRMRMPQQPKTLADLEPEAYRLVVQQHFDEAVLERVPVWHLIAYRSAERDIVYKRLLLPLSKHGDSVDFFLSFSMMSKMGI